eukprot:ANDGO_07626.mRNA.1 DENN domain and WD repeat-containing protein SCD1
MGPRVTSRLVDYFVVVSHDHSIEPIPLDPLSHRMATNVQNVRFRPSIVDSYPGPNSKSRSDFDLPQSLAMFCMPEGISLKDRSDFPTYHNIVLTGGDGARVYGCCVTFWEPLGDVSMYEKLKKQFEARRLQQLALTARMANAQRSRPLMVSSSTLASGTSAADLKRAEKGDAKKSLFSSNVVDDDGGDDLEDWTEDDEDGASVDFQTAADHPAFHTAAPSSTVVSANGSPSGGKGHGDQIASLNDRISALNTKFPELLFVPKTICILSHWPLYATFRSFLVELYRLSISPCPLPLERIVCNFCEEVPVPPMGKIAVQYTIGHLHLSIARPPRNDFPLSEIPITQVFECLSIQNVIKVVTAVLLERKMVFVCSQYSVLTNVAESFCALIFPFRWQHVYIPVLPSCYAEFLSAPVPFIMGLHSSARAQLQLSPDIIVVDLDNNTVAIPKDALLPKLPEKQLEKLVSKLQEFVPPFVAQHPNPHLLNADLAIHFAPTPDLVDSFDEAGERVFTFSSKSIQEAFLRFFVSLFLKYRTYLKNDKDFENPFDTKSFMVDLSSQGRKFMDGFVGTQMFLQFCHERMDDSLSKSPEVVFFDESIDAKMNRSLLQIRKKATPFLSDNQVSVIKTFVAMTPEAADLDSISDDHLKLDRQGSRKWLYDRFPKLNMALIYQPREAKSFVSEDVDDVGYRASALSSWKTVLATLAVIQALPDHRIVAEEAPQTIRKADKMPLLAPKITLQPAGSKSHQRSITFAGNLASNSSNNSSPQNVQNHGSHSNGGTPPLSLMQRWKARLSRSSFTQDISQSASFNQLDSAALNEILTASGTQMKGMSAETFFGNGEADDHWRVFEMLRFDLSDSCPQCEEQLLDEDIQRGWSNDRNDYRTTCPHCYFRFVARFRVFAPTGSSSNTSSDIMISGISQIVVNNERRASSDTDSESSVTSSTTSHTRRIRHTRKLSSEIIVTHAQEGDNAVVNCEFLSPAVIRKEVLNCLNQGVAADDKFFLEHPTIFWNLILQFRELPIPLTFLLPQVDWGMVADHFRQKSSRQLPKALSEGVERFSE